MHIFVVQNTLLFNGKTYRCAIGKGGFSTDKKEGDGTTPIGIFLLRECWYRADRIEKPNTKLPLNIIHENDGWCDDPKSPDYNRHIKIPYDSAIGQGEGTPPPLPLGEGRGEGFYDYTQPKYINKARNLRKNSTSPEQRLWAILRNRQMYGYKFRRQHPIAPYIADFFCDDLKLIVEVDGDSHATDIGLSKDAKRAAYLRELGYRIIRFSNHDIMHNLEVVYEALTLTLSQRERGYEKLWRSDHCYDLVIPLGYNDAPAIAGKGSAIFLHCMHDDMRPTEGCIALAKSDLLSVLLECNPQTFIHIDNS